MQAPLLFFTGVHLAGPRLTAKTFRAGLFRFPSAPDTTPTRLHLSWGRHHIWPGVDLTGRRRRHRHLVGSQRDRSRRGRHDGTGLYRYADGGARYLPGKWPTKPVGLYDDATSVTVLTQPPVDAST